MFLGLSVRKSEVEIRVEGEQPQKKFNLSSEHWAIPKGSRKQFVQLKVKGTEQSQCSKFKKRGGGTGN